MKLVYTVVEAVKSNTCSVGQQGGDPEGQDVGQVQKHLLEKLSFLREVSLSAQAFSCSDVVHPQDEALCLTLSPSI